MQFNQWKTTKSCYDLVETKSGVFIYVPNDSHPNPNPTHYLCTNCFNKSIISILQLIMDYGTGFCDYQCPDCKMKIGFNPNKI